MFQSKSTLLVLLMSFSVSLVGCSGYKAGNASGSSQTPAGSGTDTDTELQSLNKDLDDVDASILEVTNEIKKIDIPLLGAASNSGAQQGLDKEIRKIFEKLVGAVEKVFGKMDEVELKVRAELAKLDPTNPLHAAALIKLNEALGYLQQLKARIGEKLRDIGTKIDDLIAKVDSKLAAMDPKNPLSWVAAIAWQSVKTTVLEYRDRLVALAP